MKRLNKKGFTLIELLAVIIILGILMIIAIPSVTEYINNSRKSAYLDTASGYISGVRTKVNELKQFVFTDTTVAYYVPVSNVKADSCISLEKGGTSPFGDWENAYVVVTFDGTSYTYYFTAKDKAGYGMDRTLEADFENSKVTAGWANTFPADNSEITVGTNTYTVLYVEAPACTTPVIPPVNQE